MSSTSLQPLNVSEARDEQKSKPLVSIVVPSYNQARYLPTALDSVMFQDYTNIELIICNHGSTDDTSAVIRDFLSAVKRENVSYLSFMSHDYRQELVRYYEPRYPQNRIIKVLETDENIGSTESYNEGFRAATGEFCMYLVGDDFLAPHAITSMVEAFQAYTSLDIVYADMFVVDDACRILQRLSKPDYSFQRCFADWFHLGVCRLYRRSLHEVVGFYDPEYRNANDYDMFLRFAMVGARLFHLDEVLYYVRKHDQEDPDEPASWRNNGYDNLIREAMQCVKRARAWLQNNCVSDDHRANLGF